MRRPRRFGGERGQSVAELAITIPVLLLVLLFAIDFGRVFQSVVTLNNGARVGANYAATHPYAWDAISSPTDVEQQADYAAEVQRETAGIGCVMTFPPPPTFPGNSLSFGEPAKLDLKCTFRPLTPIIGAIIGSNLPITATAIFPIRAGIPGEDPPTPPCFNQASIPFIIGLTPAAANTAIVQAGLIPQGAGTATTGQPNDVKTQNPAGGACAPLGSIVSYTFRP
jgi:hypothetical protein